MKSWNLVWEGLKTLWEKEKMLVISIFFLFPQYLQKPSVSVVVKSRECEAKFNENSKPLSLKVPIAPNLKGVCLQNTSKSHSYHFKILRLL